MTSVAPGRSVLVVGGSSGIGLATALRLARAGDRLTLVARDAGSLEAARQACLEAGAHDAEAVVADVNDPDAVHLAVRRAVDRFGRLDAVVHTATVMAYGTVTDLEADIFMRVVDTAVRGTLYVARAAMQQFRVQGAGTLVVVNSLLGSVTVPNMGAYSTAKWGQRAIARTLQQEVRREPGVHVCILSPGSINTPIYYQAANALGRAARPPVPVLQPERAAAAIARLLDRPRKHVSVPVGPANPVVVAGFRALPFLYDLMVGPLFTLAALTSREQPPTDGNVREPTPELERTAGRWPAR